MEASQFKNNRILSLDAFRGLTIALMILVNSPGNRFPYPVLEHAKWNGCTFADIVFPCFLFIIGVSCVISLRNKKDIESKASLYQGIVQRSLILFMLGLMLNIYPRPFDWETLRVYGILQRIAVCYLATAIIYLNTTVRAQILIFIGILLGYWLVMTQIPVPGYGSNQLTPEGSWVAYFDQLLFSSKRLFEKIYDPEGFFSTIPAIANTLAGLLIGSLLLSSMDIHKKCLLMFVTGCLSLLLGWSWNYSFPINKNLWTSSFVLWTSGFALISFAFCFWVIDILGFKRWALPLKIFGMNALFAFILHVVLLKTQALILLHKNNGDLDNFRIVITEYLFGYFNPQNAALLYSSGFLLLNFMVMALLYWRKIFIRI